MNLDQSHTLSLSISLKYIPKPLLGPLMPLGPHGSSSTDPFITIKGRLFQKRPQATSTPMPSSSYEQLARRGINPTHMAAMDEMTAMGLSRKDILLARAGWKKPNLRGEDNRKVADLSPTLTVRHAPWHSMLSFAHSHSARFVNVFLFFFPVTLPSCTRSARH
jgi:hypothetical protein